MNNNRLEEKRNGGKKKELLYYIKNQAIRGVSFICSRIQIAADATRRVIIQACRKYFKTIGKF